MFENTAGFLIILASDEIEHDCDLTRRNPDILCRCKGTFIFVSLPGYRFLFTSCCHKSLLLLRRRVLASGVTSERPCRSEFTEFKSYHFLGDIYRNVSLAVVDGDGVSYEVREYRGRTGPRFKNLLLAGLVHFLYAFQ